MKLPTIVRKLRKLSYYQIVFTLFIIAMITPVSQAYMVGSSVSNFNANRDSHTNDNLITTITVSDPSIKNDIRPEELGSPYVPITQSGETSDQFTIEDALSVYDSGAMNLTNYSDTGIINESYSISNIGDYTNETLNYSITEIESLLDYYTVEDDYDGVVTFDRDDYYTFAQEFKVEWDYALFYGSKLFLTYDVGIINLLEDYELSLHLVSANSGDGKPNMTNVISNCTSNPFSESNQYADAGLQYFDFTDVQITKGAYYIVANLSKIDVTDAVRHFQWAKNDHTSDGVDGGKTLYRVTGFPGLWSTPTAYDLELINYLHPVDSNNDSIIFATPEEVNLKDNGININTNTASITTIGTHELIANTSVQITYNNSYTFSKLYSGNDVYAQLSASNSSYWAYNVLWDINWTTNSIDISPYSNLNRTQFIQTPTDWNSVFTFYYNDTNTLTGSWESNGYLMLLSANNSAGNWKLSTSSPNYVNSLTLSDDISQTERYFLGHWIGDVTDSYGYGGSNITAAVTVQTDGATVPTNETTGSLNYTLYDANGLIIPIKSSLPANLIYTDSSSYTLGGILNSSAGYYQSTITFDPSASESDLAGFWTATVFWQNGTEAGYYSLRIVVQSQTAFEFEWETEPGSNIWTTSDISRIGLDSVLVRGSYYNISEPYTTGTKNLIPSATVSYTVHNATWNKNDDFNDYAPDYNTSILIDANMDVGTYTVDLLGTGAFLENQTSSFTLTVFYELSLVPEYTNFQTNYTNNVLYYMNLYDVTASSNLSLAPDDMNVTITNGTDFPLSSPVDYNFTYQAPTEQWILNISTSTNNLYTGLYSVEISINLNNYQASYSEVFVSAVYTFEITAPKTSIEKIAYPTTIYLYHDVTFSFRFMDTNHTTALLGANVVASASVSNIDFSYNFIGDTYYVTVTNNNPSVGSFNISVDISLSNYESKTSYLLGELSVLTIQTSLTEVTTPTEVYVGYTTSIVVQFNDITHVELINVGTGTFVIITSNSSSFDDTLGYVYIGSGRYNVSFINNDFDHSGIEINITIGKTGYETASIIFEIQVLSISTDSMLVDSADQNIIIYYGEGTSIEIMYWDNISFVNITDPLASFSGNLTVIVIPTYSFLDNITTITILTILDLGYYELIITLEKPGYEPQIITVYILVQEIPTSVDSDYTETTFYADQTDQVYLNYTDEVNLEAILTATVDIDFAADNSTLTVQDYFIITLVEVGSFYEITFDPIEINATGYVFLFNMTISKYGYEINFIIITVTITIHPTAIDPTSQDQDSVYTDEDGEFTIIYETVEDTFIGGAELSYSTNGTSTEILDVVLTQILDTYVVYVYINSSIVPVTSFQIELTFYKHGFENQTLIIMIIVSIHPTAIDPSSQNQDTIYADEESEFTIVYETEEGDFIPGAEFEYNIINGTTDEILSVTYSQRTDNYVIIVYFNESLIAGANYTIELIFFKHGFKNQTWIINISVYEKITYDIDVEIVGTVQQLNTIQFEISLANLSSADLQALSSVDIKYAPSPVGDFVTIEYTFVFSNGTRVTYSIQVEIGSDYTGLSEEIYIPWMVGEIYYTVTHTPTNGAVIESTTLSNNPSLYPISPDFATLLTYLFQEFTVYMIIGLALVAILFITLTVYFAVIRPKKQRRSAKKKRYLDKISKILTSVLSLRKVIVVHNDTGLPIYEWDLGETMTVDSSLVSGFLQAVSGMGGEISGGKAQAVRKIDYGQFCVSSSSTENITTYLFSTGDISVDVEEGLASFINWFAKKFQGTLEGQWDGITDVFEQASRAIVDRLSEDIFIWTLHPLSINPLKEKDAAKLDSFSQKLFKFIKDYKEVTISVSLEYFNKSPIEVTLTKLFELVDNTFLLRKRLR